MKDPAFLFYSNDFYEGTRTMLPEERACYIDLLIYQHHHEYIPTDIKRIMMYCSGVSEATLEATLEAKFKLCEKGWYNEKLREVILERKEFSKKQSDNGLVGQFFKNAKSKLKASEYKNLYVFLKKMYSNEELAKELKTYENKEASLQAMLKAMLKHLEDEDEIEDEDEDVNNNKGVKINFPFKSEKFFKEWQRFKEYKKTHHKFKYKSIDSEQTALNKLKDISHGREQEAIDIINTSIANGWAGLFQLDPMKAKRVAETPGFVINR